VTNYHFVFEMGAVRKRIEVNVSQRGETPEEVLNDVLGAIPNVERCEENTSLCRVREVSQVDSLCVRVDEGAVGDLADNPLDIVCTTRHSAVVLSLQKKESRYREQLTGKPMEESEPAYCQVSSLFVKDAQREDDVIEALHGHQEAQCAVAACGEKESKLDYNVIRACHFQMKTYPAVGLLLFVLFVYFILMGVLADGYLVPSLVKIGRTLKMSDALLGATLLALGGAANDTMVGFASALQNAKKHSEDTINGGDNTEIKMWLGGVFGTGFFINTFVAACVMFFAGSGGIDVKPNVLTRDIGFRMLAVALMLFYGHQGYITALQAITMILVYVIYVLVTLSDRSKETVVLATNRNTEAQIEDDGLPSTWQPRGTALLISKAALTSGSEQHKSFAVAAQQPKSQNPCETVCERLKRHFGWAADASFIDKLSFLPALPFRPFFILTMATNEWDPLVNVLLPLGMCALCPYAYPFGNLYAEEGYETVVVGFLVVGFLLSVLVLILSLRSPGVYIAPFAFQCATFVTAVLWISLVANEVVEAMKALGAIWGIDEMAMGITMLAWGNCIDNVFATIGLAKAQEFGVAITGIYAAPMFNVLFANGSILLMLTIIKGEGPFTQWKTEFVMSTCPKVLLWSLEAILLTTLIWAKCNGWKMTKAMGVVLGVSYPLILGLGFYVGSKFD
jgi:Ca2+/Na+ antiporter